jgi:hypothetical protein
VALVSLAWGVEEASASAGSSLFPSVCNRFSRPSTRFSRASRTSVFGPLFFGTASVAVRQPAPYTRLCDVAAAERTINTCAIEHLTSFTSWPCAVAFDLLKTLEIVAVEVHKNKTFRLRQLLQFIASRGSFEKRRAGRRSIPICGLDIAAAIDCETLADIETV